MRKFYGEQCTATVGRSAVADRDGVKVSAVVGVAMVAAMVGVVRRSRFGSVGNGRAVGDGRRCECCRCRGRDRLAMVGGSDGRRL